MKRDERPRKQVQLELNSNERLGLDEVVKVRREDMKPWGADQGTRTRTRTWMEKECTESDVMVIWEEAFRDILGM